MTLPTIDDMFPPSPREHYEKAPLVLLQVICAVQFPRVLRLENQAPAEFQDTVKKAFPLYERPVLGLPPAVQIPQQVLMQLMAGQAAATQHVFISEDRKSNIALTPENLTYTSLAYTSWEDFSGLLYESLKALESQYHPPFFSRLSLRYMNVLNRDKLGLPDRPWSELINTEVAGQFPLSHFEACTQEIAHKLTLKLPDGTGSATIQQGFVLLGGVPRSPGKSYMLDFEFYQRPKIEIKDAEQRLDHFHDLAGRAFRWSITPALKAALGPVPAPDRSDQRAAVAR